MIALMVLLRKRYAKAWRKWQSLLRAGEADTIARRALRRLQHRDMWLGLARWRDDYLSGIASRLSLQHGASHWLRRDLNKASLTPEDPTLTSLTLTRIEMRRHTLL